MCLYLSLDLRSCLMFKLCKFSFKGFKYDCSFIPERFGWNKIVTSISWLTSIDHPSDLFVIPRNTKYQTRIPNKISAKFECLYSKLKICYLGIFEYKFDKYPRGFSVNWIFICVTNVCFSLLQIAFELTSILVLFCLIIRW